MTFSDIPKYKQRSYDKKDNPYSVVGRSSAGHYLRPRCTVGERCVGESVVSVGGYIDSLELIGQMLDAGENLQALRIAMSGMTYNYDVVDDSVKDSDIVLPVSRTRGFDLVDWSNLKRDIEGKIRLLSDEQREQLVTAHANNESTGNSEVVTQDTPPAAVSE